MNDLVEFDDPLYRQMVVQSDASRIQLIQDMMNGLSENTRIAYRKGVNMYFASGFSLPATAVEVAEYVRTATLWQIQNGVLVRTKQRISINTLRTHLAALSFFHKCIGVADPCSSIEVRMAMKAEVTQKGTDVETRAKPLLRSDIVKILGTLRYEHEPTLIDLRDASLLMIGFTAALRRSEICALRVEDLQFCEDGVILTLRRSKWKNFAFKKGLKRTGKPLCPVRILKRWLTYANISSGYVFRSIRGDTVWHSLSHHAVNDRLKLLCRQAGIPVTVQHSAEDVELTVSGHSLRAGFVTECRRQGIPDWVVMKMTGHKDARNLSIYTRDVELFENNASCDLWQNE
jgi:integrase